MHQIKEKKVRVQKQKSAPKYNLLFLFLFQHDSSGGDHGGPSKKKYRNQQINGRKLSYSSAAFNKKKK